MKAASAAACSSTSARCRRPERGTEPDRDGGGAAGLLALPPAHVAQVADDHAAAGLGERVARGPPTGGRRPGVVAARVGEVGLVEHRQQPGALLDRRVRRDGRVPEGVAVNLGRGHPVAEVVEGGRDLALGRGRPAHQVRHRGRPVAGEVPQHQVAQGLVALRDRRRRHPLVDERIGVLAIGERARAHQAVQLGQHQQVSQPLPAEVVAGERRPGAVDGSGTGRPPTTRPGCRAGRRRRPGRPGPAAGAGRSSPSAPSVT